MLHTIITCIFGIIFSGKLCFVNILPGKLFLAKIISTSLFLFRSSLYVIEKLSMQNCASGNELLSFFLLLLRYLVKPLTTSFNMRNLEERIFTLHVPTINPDPRLIFASNNLYLFLLDCHSNYKCFLLLSVT